MAAAAAATKWIEIRASATGDETPAGSVFLGFGACLALSFWAGRLQKFPPGAPRAPAAPPAPVSGRRAIAAIGLGVFSAAAFALTAKLQSRDVNVPLEALATWAVSLVAAGLAFAAAARGAAPEERRRMPPAAVAALALLLAAAGYFRLADLGRSPAVFGGDEANQTRDAIGLLTRAEPSDPFGTGWYGAARLGMLPAGLGAILSNDPIAGPRIPYGIAGSLSVAAAAAAGWLVAGTWGALAAAALLAVAPYHLHFSRLASHMILDSLAATVFVALALAARRRSSLPLAYGAGAAAGLALYGYSSGRILPILLLFAAPFLIRSGRGRGRRAALAAALAAGFLLAAAPNLTFASRHFDDWNSRWNQTGIFRADWWQPAVATFGSPARVLLHQVVAGSAGLLFRHSLSPWYTRYPIAGPGLLLGLGTAGLGWLLGRRRSFAGGLLALLVAGNLAAVALTDATPTPQRPSSLFPALAILGGAAIAAVVGLVVRCERGPTRFGALLGASLVAAVFLADPESSRPGTRRIPGTAATTRLS